MAYEKTALAVTLDGSGNGTAVATSSTTDARVAGFFLSQTNGPSSHSVVVTITDTVGGRSNVYQNQLSLSVNDPPGIFVGNAASEGVGTGPFTFTFSGGPANRTYYLLVYFEI